MFSSKFLALAREVNILAYRITGIYFILPH
jgi:hypothetical protein